MTSCLFLEIFKNFWFFPINKPGSDINSQYGYRFSPSNTDVDNQSNSDPSEVENFYQSEYTNKENKLTNEIETKADKKINF